ncbi:MAG: heavy metal translocating P-type ATPase, partial [Hamadaea sp.]|nr:heavy metal translocating P-type ATPase [Hamadaea sp.]
MPDTVNRASSSQPGPSARIWAARDSILFSLSTLLLLGGVLAASADANALATILWTSSAGIGLAYSTVTIGLAVRRRQPSVDVIAWLALVGALLVGEPVAGAVIAVMLFTGGVLEARASVRARRELSALAARAPRVARRQSPRGIEEVPVDRVAIGDRLLVGAGEIVPVDGRLTDAGVFDESALSGEANPVDRPAGDDVRSGVVNAGSAVTMVATQSAAESTYAGVVRLVEQAQSATAPFVRLADRFAVGFVPLTLA